MRVWLYVDEVGVDCLDETPEDEYVELESKFRGWLPDHVIEFRRNVLPHELKNGAPDIYLFDIGGMCAFDWNGERRLNFCGNVVQQVDEHPNTLFIPYTKMTRDTLRFALSEYLPEFRDVPEEDREYPNQCPRFNVWCPPKSEDPDYELGDMPAKVKEWSTK